MAPNLLTTPPLPHSVTHTGPEQTAPDASPSSTGRPDLQINGCERPAGGEQRKSDQCKRRREQKPLSICPGLVGRGD